MKRNLFFFAFAFTAAFALAGCTAPGDDGAEVHVVRMVNTQFDPRELTIDLGDTVRWVNQDNMRHDVNALDGSFRSGSNNMSPGATFEHTFLQPGVYEYRCTPHSNMEGTAGMTGTIIVRNADGSLPSDEGNGDDTPDDSGDDGDAGDA
jgi:plastocyanin